MATGQGGASALPWRCCWRLPCLCFRAVPRSSRRGRGKKERIPGARAGPQEQTLQDGPGAQGQASKDEPGSQEDLAQEGPAVGQQPPAHPKSRTPKSRAQKSRKSLLCSRIPRRSRSRPRRLSRPSRHRPPQTAPAQPAQPVQSCTLVVECSTVLDHMDEL